MKANFSIYQINSVIARVMNESLSSSSTIEKAKQLLSQVNNGAKPWDIYDDIKISSTPKVFLVKIDTKWAILNNTGPNHYYIANTLFDDAESFSKGLYRVFDKEKGWKIINDDGGFLYPEIKFKEIGFPYSYSPAIVKSSTNEYNYINTLGQLISDRWFLSVSPFNSSSSYAEVYYRDKDGKIKQDFLTIDGKLYHNR